MPRLVLRLDSQAADARLKALGARAPVAIARGLNRAGKSGRTAMARVVSKDMGLKVSDVRDRIAVRDATPRRLVVTLFASAKRLPLILFKATGPEPSFGRGRGVSANLGGRKRYPRAFIATMGAGHRGVFERHGKLRLPIYELFGPSIAMVFKKHEQVGLDRAQEMLAKTLGHELEFEMSRT